MSAQKIIVSNLSKTFASGIHALKDASFDVSEGEVIYVLGESGSGKSTLVRILGGLEDADEGMVTVDAERITGPSENLVPGYEDIAYVSQDYKLQAFWTVEDNIGKKISHLPEVERKETILEWLSLFQLETYMNSMPGALSGGQQQRIAIAAALIDQPPVILLDEPFSNLDLPMKARMRRDMIEKLRNHGTTILLISHDPAEAMAVADRILLLRQGSIVQYDTPENLYRKPESSYAAAFLGPVNELIIKGKPMLVRPENLVFDPKGEFKGKIKQCTFAGSHYQCEIRMDGQPNPVLAYAREKMAVNTRVQLHITF